MYIYNTYNVLILVVIRIGTNFNPIDDRRSIADHTMAENRRVIFRLNYKKPRKMILRTSCRGRV